MITRAPSVMLTQASNGTVMRKTFEDRLQTALLTILTSGIVGCFIFLWNTNSNQARSEERDIRMMKAIDDVNGKMNNMQLDIREIRDKVIRVETLKTQK